MFVRPKPGDKEEDILAMQEAFMAEKEKNKEFEPSAKVVNLRKHKTDVTKPVQSSPKQSKYAESKGLRKDGKVTFSDSPTIFGEEAERNGNLPTDKDVQDDKVYYPEVMPFVMGEIVEKNTNLIESPMQNMSTSNASGFPAVRKRDKTVSSGSKSIFAQQMKKKNKMDVDDLLPKIDLISDVVVKMDVASSPCPEQSVILQGEDAASIHNENTVLLEGMSEKEIMEEREKLRDMLDPGLLEYIKSLRKKDKKPTSDVQPTHEIQSPPETVKTEVLNIDLADNDVITHPNLQNWIHFDTLERDKLQWIKNMEAFDSKHSDKPYEARFDFKGYLLPYSMDYTEETKTLFHHGEDAHRPGYSLSELFQLSRSTVTQQRVLALNSIAGILEYYSLGIYKGVINVPITKIFFVLRFALDENITIVLEPTLKALRNLFYNRVDEACLDFLLGSENGLLQPRLISKKFENEDTDSDVSELKDFHLVDLDLVSGAIRTDMLTRIRYILNTVKPTASSVEYCLEILTRMARGTLENAETLSNVDGLLECIILNYIPKFISTVTTSKTDTDNCKIILSALKLIRILVCQSKKTAERCYSEFNITDCLLNYIGNTVAENIFVLKIQIETLYLWSSLLTYGIGLNKLMDLTSVLHKVLDNHIRGTDMKLSYPVVMHSHAAALITLLTNARLAASHVSVSHFDYLKEFHHLIVLGAQKWTSQVTSLENFTAGHLKSLSALLIYLNITLQLDREKVHGSIDILNACVKRMINSDGFSKITAKMVDCSNLLSANDDIANEKDKTESSIPGLESSVISNSQNLLPTITALSPISFISSLSKYIYTSKNKDLAISFIQQKNIFHYIKKISLSNQLNLSDNWFSKVELDILCNCVCISASLDFSDAEKELLYNFAFKLTYILSPEYRNQLEVILKQIVFNKKWFTTDRLLRNLNISETDNILNHLDAIFQCYANVLRLNYKDETSSLTVSDWDQKILPRDWMFLPILGLYTKSQDPEDPSIPKEFLKTKEELIKNVVICSLEWILVSELYFPEITNEIGLTDRFCRLSCVFLCDNSLFLDAAIKPLLHKCIKIIFNIENSSSSNKLNFDKNLLGINNFQDLYTQLVDQFQAVSYGDPTFAACILVPLAQQHNIKWRKLVWSEYAACLRALDCPEELLCYKMENYLNPAELDFSLLKSYHRALISNLLRQGTIAYKIAKSHVDYAQSRQKARNSS